MSAKPHIEIFTDGACRGNPGPGGWGALLRFNDHEKKLKGADQHTTNNQMELTAVIQALSELKRSCKIDLTTDSEYVRKGITEWVKKWQQNGWKTTAKKPVKNKELWELLVHESEKHDISWHWIKGHSGHPENELADELANQAIDEMLR